jgi:hypothetical protein
LSKASFLNDVLKMMMIARRVEIGRRHNCDHFFAPVSGLAMLVRAYLVFPFLIVLMSAARGTELVSIAR